MLSGPKYLNRFKAITLSRCHDFLWECWKYILKVVPCENNQSPIGDLNFLEKPL